MNERGVPSEMIGGAEPPLDRPAKRVGHEHARPALADAVLDGDHHPVAGGVGQHGRIGVRHHPDVPDRGVDPVGLQLVGRLLGRGEHLPHGQDAHRAVARAGAAGVKARAHRRPGAPGRRGLREADDRGAVELEGLGQHDLDLGRRRRGEHRHARDGQGEGHVQDAVVAGPVVTGDAGPVEHQDHRQPVQADVEIGLVEGAAEEGRVDRHHRAQAGHGHAGGGGHRVLLGDADVEEPVGEPGLEGEEPGGAGHGGGDGHDPRIGLGMPEQRTGEGVGERGHRQVGAPAAGRAGPAGRRTAARVGRLSVGDGLDDQWRADLEVVEALDVVLFGGGVAPALLGEDVDHDGTGPLRALARACSMPAMSWPSMGPA